MTDDADLDNPDPADCRLIIGCGYLGKRVAARWRERGLRVFATTRSRADELRGLGLYPIVADILHQDSIPPLPQVTTMIQCVGFDRKERDSLRDIYVIGLANVLSRLPPEGKLIYVSSTGVYGTAEGGEVDESTLPAPTDETGELILAAEQLLRAERPDAIVLRFAGIYGPGRLPREKAIRAGQPLATDPDAWLNLIHVEDGASAILAAEENGVPGATYNVADGNPVTRRDFFLRMADVLGAVEPTFIAERKSARGTRRIGNRKMVEELGVMLHHPSYEEGLAPKPKAPKEDDTEMVEIPEDEVRAAEESGIHLQDE